MYSYNIKSYQNQNITQILLCFNVMFVSLFVSGQTLNFTQITAIQSGISFKNQLNETEEISALLYDNIYSGGGVAIGDVNNDGRPDIYLGGNQVGDKLYLNKGSLKFEDITEKAGIVNKNTWSSGVTMVDINGDGWLDIYVCKTLHEKEEDLRANELYINQKDGTFKDEAEKWGVASTQRSQHATFIDYDKDGDLDLFLVNQPPNPGIFSPLKKYDWRKPEYGCQLFQHNGTSFKNVTIEARVSEKGYGLGVSAGDYNNDGWVDLYVTNDYNSPDFLYINQQNGTFKNTLKESMGHISFFSMGTDAADINDDGLLDIAVLDMVAEDNYRLKANMGGMDIESFWQTVEEGGHFQYMFNTLQLNRGADANGLVHFSDVAQMAGTAYSDWSWSPLFADYDNDGDKDLYCTNGLVRDLRNTDALKNMKIYSAAATQKFQIDNPTKTDASLWDIIDYEVALNLFPSQPLSNYFFQNKGEIQFENEANTVGLDQKGFSTGAAYGDLDGDGDLDLVVNNLNAEAWLFQNENKGNYLRVQVKDGLKRSLFGTRITATIDGKEQHIELTSARGFYSSSENIAHFGLGKAKKVNELKIQWLDGTIYQAKNIKGNQLLTIDKSKYKTILPQKESTVFTYQNVTKQMNLNIKHQENTYDDFDKEVLLPHKMSQLGPALAVADVNGDGLEDFFVGGAKGFSGTLVLQTQKGTFEKVTNFTTPQHFEDVDAAFFDADLDGDIDLYVVSGGNEAAIGSEQYKDQLYLNQGTYWSIAALPNFAESGSVVRPFDYDGDGDMDLFIGGRQMPSAYPRPASSYILKNTLKETGKFTFEDVTASIAPELANIGMVTDAIWTDYDQDKDLDLLLTGEWMPITFLENANGKFKKKVPLENTEGWWFSTTATDIDGDGDMDYLLGNLGLNSKYNATTKEPFSVHYDDFDENGSYDIVLSYYNFGTKYPVRGRSCSSQQIPEIGQKFPTYDMFAQADIFEVYGKDKLQQALNLDVYNFSSSWLENKGKGKFELQELPRMAQISAINDWLIVEKDGRKEIVLAGNMFNTEIETTKADAGKGLVLSIGEKGKISAIEAAKSGLYIPNEVRQLEYIIVNGQKMILVACNNDGIQLWKY